MENQEFIIVPKLIGLIVDSRSGEAAGFIDASELLTRESQEALAEAMGNVVGRVQVETAREQLEQAFLLPAAEKD